MRFALAAFTVMALSLTAADMSTAPPVLRPAPEFVIHFPGGQQKLLSQYRGKVIALEFAYTTCPHCQHATGIFSKLNTEYGPRGFQPLGVAFNDNAEQLLPGFLQTTGANYPVGFSPREPVLNFMNFSVMERFVVPQIVWIDRNGNIRSQTPAQGDEKLLTEAGWREMIEKLLAEKPHAAAGHHTVSKLSH